MTKDLTKLSAEQLQEFLASFDVVLSDIDGVVWEIDTSIPGAFQSLMKLQNLGKQVYLVTNNSIFPTEYYQEKARYDGLDISLDHIINTAKVIVWYLKKVDFHGEVFAIASETFQNVLKKAGFQLTEEPKVSVLNPRTTVNDVLDRPSVKAVIADFDINCNWSKLALAISCLKREDVLFISGTMDTWVGNCHILGPGPLINVISTQSKRSPLLCAKPSQILKDYILQTCNVSDPRRCLFIGDTIDQDMKFASMCGFTKLFVGTGRNTLEEAQREHDACPDYYLPSLGQLRLADTNSERQNVADKENN